MLGRVMAFWTSTSVSAITFEPNTDHIFEPPLSKLAGLILELANMKPRREEKEKRDAKWLRGKGHLLLSDHKPSSEEKQNEYHLY